MDSSQQHPLGGYHQFPDAENDNFIPQESLAGSMASYLDMNQPEPAIFTNNYQSQGPNANHSMYGEPAPAYVSHDFPPPYYQAMPPVLPGYASDGHNTRGGSLMAMSGMSDNRILRYTSSHDGLDNQPSYVNYHPGNGVHIVYMTQNTPTDLNMLSDAGRMPGQAHAQRLYAINRQPQGYTAAFSPSYTMSMPGPSPYQGTASQAWRMNNHGPPSGPTSVNVTGNISTTANGPRRPLGLNTLQRASLQSSSASSRTSTASSLFSNRLTISTTSSRSSAAAPRPTLSDMTMASRQYQCQFCTMPFAKELDCERHEFCHCKHNPNQVPFTCLEDICTPECASPCKDDFHHTPHTHTRADKFNMHLRTEHNWQTGPKNVPRSWVWPFKQSHDHQQWECGLCGEKLGTWADDVARIKKHEDDCKHDRAEAARKVQRYWKRRSMEVPQVEARVETNVNEFELPVTLDDHYDLDQDDKDWCWN